MCFIENAWLCKPNLIKSHNSYFIVPDEKLAIQVSYSIKEETTYNREMPPLVKYANVHEDWKCLMITYDEEGTEEGIPVVPVWKWLVER